MEAATPKTVLSQQTFAQPSDLIIRQPVVGEAPAVEFQSSSRRPVGLGPRRRLRRLVERVAARRPRREDAAPVVFVSVCMTMSRRWRDDDTVKARETPLGAA